MHEYRVVIIWRLLMKLQAIETTNHVELIDMRIEFPAHDDQKPFRTLAFTCLVFKQTYASKITFT